MKAINDILGSGHRFSEDENLLKFRFFWLNALLMIALFFTLLNFILSSIGVIDQGRIFDFACVIFFSAGCTIFYLLRRNRSSYSVLVNFFMIINTLFIYFAVLTRSEDDLRLLSFFITIFVGYVLLGRKYGLGLSVFIVVSIYLFSKTEILGYSKLEYSTFFTFTISFAVILYFFLKKVESDAVEFKVLNSRLETNFRNETQQRKDQEVMLLHQCRMANMGEMLDSIAHQWRQPLMHINSILMNMDVALDTKQKDENYLTQKVNEVATLTQHMSQTIDDFRGLFKLETKQHQFSVELVIDEVLALMKNRFDNIAIENKSVGDTLTFGYKNELIQVIIILLNNAVDAFEKKPINNRFISINTSVSQDISLITIEDNAGGIVAKNTAEIFNPYFTTKELSGGTGIGLYIAKIIVEQKMNGTITAANTAEGAIFTISFAHNPNG